MFKILATTLVVAFFTCVYTCSTAQALQTGDTISLRVLQNLRQQDCAGTTPINFGQAQLIILDFWSTNCIGCLLSFPKMDSLQRKFKESVQVVFISRQSADSICRFFLMHPRIIKPHLPFVTDDKLLNRLFPHQGEPFHVWIDRNRVVRSISYGFNTTESDVSQFLHSSKIEVAQNSRIKSIESLLDSNWQKSVVYYSCLSKCIDGTHLTAAHFPNSVDISVNCSSIAELYQMAFNDSNVLSNPYERPGRLLLEARDTIKYVRQRGGNYPAWSHQFSYNYQLIIPESAKNLRYNMMRADLLRYFNLDARIEKRPVLCYVLVRTSPINKIQSNGGKPMDNFTKTKYSSITVDSIRYYQNLPYERFSERFTLMFEKSLNQPFVDQTDLSGMIDIYFNGSSLDSMNIKILRQEFKKYDLELIEKEVLLPVLVIGN